MGMDVRSSWRCGIVLAGGRKETAGAWKVAAETRVGRATDAHTAACRRERRETAAWARQRRSGAHGEATRSDVGAGARQVSSRRPLKAVASAGATACAILSLAARC